MYQVRPTPTPRFSSCAWVHSSFPVSVLQEAPFYMLILSWNFTVRGLPMKICSLWFYPWRVSYIIEYCVRSVMLERFVKEGWVCVTDVGKDSVHERNGNTVLTSTGQWVWCLPGCYSGWSHPLLAFIYGFVFSVVAKTVFIHFYVCVWVSLFVFPITIEKL